MRTHVVSQGEHLASIARQAGFLDWRRVWEHPANQALRRKRRNPHVLFPGDEVALPEAEPGFAPARTDRTHHFVVRRPPLQLLLRIVLRDFSFHPLPDRSCTLRIDGADVSVRSDAKGRITHPIPPTATFASLTVEGESGPLALELPIRIGHLDPVDTRSGQVARLNNLGYFTGPTEREDDAGFRSAVEEFQLENMGLRAVDGVCGPLTQERLLEVHGS